MTTISRLGLLVAALLSFPAATGDHPGAAPRAPGASTASGLSRQADGQVAFDPARLMADVRTYHDFGVHRTAHPGDRRTSEWLAQRFRALGVETSAHNWQLRQFFLDEASLEDALGRIPAFPIWLPRATPPDGLTARLALVDESTPAREMAGTIAWLQPSEATARSRLALDRKAIAAGAAAIVFATSDRGGTGLFAAVNAERQYVDVERPVPTLTFGAADAERLRESVGREVTMRLTGR